MPLQEPFKAQPLATDLTYGLADGISGFIEYWKPHGVTILPQSKGMNFLFKVKIPNVGRFQTSAYDANRQFIEDYPQNAYAQRLPLDSDLEQDPYGFRRKCKAILHWQLIHRNLGVNFVLDGIDLKKVADKIVGVPGAQNASSSDPLQKHHDITAAELRWIFRHRENTNVNQNVQFFLAGHPVAPPWEFPAVATNWAMYDFRIETKFQFDLFAD